MHNNINKIFGIGLSRTGTTSLTKALEILGYKSKHFPKIHAYRGKELKLNTKIIDKYRAFTDTPVARFYKELDKKYPGSKFILTIRDKKSWLKSCRKFFSKRDETNTPKRLLKLHKDLYNTSSFNKKEFNKSYDKHINGVLSHFKKRNSDLLIIDITKGDGWEKLCPFLKKPYPSVPFPNLNISQKLKNKIQGNIGLFLKRNVPNIYTIAKDAKFSLITPLLSGESHKERRKNL